MQSQESKWISKHSNIINRYTGKWVAILGNKGVIASGDTIKELTKELKNKGISELPLITKIPRDDEAMSIL